MEQIERCKKVLSEHGHSITQPRLDVFRALLSADEPIAITELSARLHDSDKLRVYRTGELFAKIGIVQRVWAGFKSKVELSETFSPHHHHFTCMHCSKTISILSDELEEILEKLEHKNNFKLIHHSIELNGYCAECRDKA